MKYFSDYTLILFFLLFTISSSGVLRRNELKTTTLEEKLRLQPILPIKTWVQFKNKLSGKCLKLVILNNQLIQSDCFSWQEGAWMILKKTIGEDYLIKNMSSDYYLDNYANGAIDGTELKALLRNIEAKQDWRITSYEGTNYFKIVSSLTQKCIDVKGNENNELVKQMSCNEADSQSFEIINYTVPHRNSALPIDKWVNIIHSESGKCIKFKGINTQLELEACSSNNDYAWNLSFNSVDGSYFICSKIGNYLLENYHDRVSNGNSITASIRNGAVQQQWYLKTVESGNIAFVSKNTNKCIDFNHKDGKKELTQMDCISKSKNQAFTFQLQSEFGVPALIPLNSWLQIIVKANKKCLKFNGRNRQIIQEECSSDDQFLWNISWNSFDNTYFITSKNGNYLFDNYANGQTNGNRIFAWDRHGGVQQNFNIIPSNDDYFELTTKGSPKCVTVQNSNSISNLVQWECSKTDYQYFGFNAIQSNLNKPNSSIPLNKWIQIINRESGKCIKFNGAAAQVVNADCYNSQEYQWNISWNSIDNSYFITNGVTDSLQGYLLDNYANLNQNGNRISSVIRQGKIQQNWLINTIDNNSIQLVTKGSNKCIQTYKGNKNNYALYQLWDCNNQQTQAYGMEVIAYPLPQYDGIPTDQWVQIVNKSTGKCIKYNSLNGALVQSNCNSSDEFYFNFSWNSWDGTYFISSKKNVNALFDNYANSQNEGNAIISNARNGGAQQHWFLKDFTPGYFMIIAKGSVKCVTVSHGSNLDGETIKQYECREGASEQGWSYQGGDTEILFVSLRGLIKDATNNNIISDEQLNNNLAISFINVTTNKVYSASIRGSMYSIRLPPGNYRRIAKHNTYSISNITIAINISSDEDNGVNTVLLSPIIQGYRIILTWTASPKDLDSRLRLPDGSEVFYNNRSILNGGISLDVIKRGGYGPETFTIINSVKSGIFKYYVKRYSNDGQLINSRAKVAVYHGDQQIKEFNIPTNQEESNIWYVFNLNMETGNIENINKLTNLIK